MRRSPGTVTAAIAVAVAVGGNAIAIAFAGRGTGWFLIEQAFEALCHGAPPF
jgi:hypothetical protein